MIRSNTVTTAFPFRIRDIPRGNCFIDNIKKENARLDDPHGALAGALWYTSSMTLLIIVILLMIIGLAGVLLPFLPGVPLAWLGFFIYAYSTDFKEISLTTTLVFLGLTILSILLEFALPLLGAKKYHASKHGMAGAAMGLAIGPFLLGPIGIVAGPFVGAVAGEFLNGNKKHALMAGGGTFVGFLLSLLLKLILTLVMIGFFIFSLA